MRLRLEKIERALPPSSEIKRGPGHYLRTSESRLCGSCSGAKPACDTLRRGGPRPEGRSLQSSITCRSSQSPKYPSGPAHRSGRFRKGGGVHAGRRQQEAVQGLIANFLEPAGIAFVEELVFRFLLTRGDALGGSMRNFGGALAQRKLTRALIASLRLAGVKYEWLHSANDKWLPMEEDDSDVELHLRGLGWSSGGRNRTSNRTLIYNLTVPIVENNVDFCLLNCSARELATATRDPKSYLALGELKGGIDPAGADEHWKTAKSALDRIRQAFAKEKLGPHCFFVGAAIAKKMAAEIWADLEAGQLKNAGNLTNQDHVSSICAWLLEI